MQAGHYVKASAGNATYFREDNVHCQCVRCNIMLDGNYVQYALAMVRKYGPEKLEELEKAKRTIKRFTAQELLDMKEHYKQEVKIMLEEYA